MVDYLFTLSYALICLILLLRLVMVITGFAKLPELLNIQKMRDVFIVSVLPVVFIREDEGNVRIIWNSTNIAMIVLYLSTILMYVLKTMV